MAKDIVHRLVGQSYNHVEDTIIIQFYDQKGVLHDLLVPYARFAQFSGLLADGSRDRAQAISSGIVSPPPTGTS